MKRKTLIKRALVWIIFNFHLILAGCCPDPEILCVNVNSIQGEIFTDNQSSSLSFDEVYFVINPTLETILCQESGDGVLLQAPTCDPDFIDYQSDFLSIIITPIADYNDEYLKGSFSNELFELAFVDVQCFNESQSIEDCQLQRIAANLFDELIIDYLIRSEEDPTADFAFVFILKEAPKLSGEFSFSFEWITDKTNLTHISDLVQLNS